MSDNGYEGRDRAAAAAAQPTGPVDQDAAVETDVAALTVRLAALEDRVVDVLACIGALAACLGALAALAAGVAGSEVPAATMTQIRAFQGKVRSASR